MGYKSYQLKMIDEAIIDCRLRGLYKLLARQKYAKFQHVVNDTIWNFQNAEEIAVDPKLMSQFINIMYICLVDLAMGRTNMVHDKIRDMHYALCTFS
jgi:hypothetical protein